MLVVTPNLCIDRTIQIEELVAGGVSRPQRAVVTLGGKGVNVARVGRALGHEVPVVGFVPEGDAERLRALAVAEGAQLVEVPVAGEARVATILIEASGRVTVLNEPGPDVDAACWQRLVERLRALLPSHSTMACSGSVPPGSPPEAYATCVEAAHAAGSFAVVDGQVQALAAALGAEPDVVTPNLAEAEAVLVGSAGELVEPSGPDVAERSIESARALVSRGARHAVVTAGSRGAAYASSRGELAWCAAPVVEVRNPVGAGDALVGGLLDRIEAGDSVAEAVRVAVAVASASCEQDLAGGLDPARALALSALVSMAPFPGNAAAGAPPAGRR